MPTDLFYRLYRHFEDIQPQEKTKQVCFAPKDEFIKKFVEEKVGNNQNNCQEQMEKALKRKQKLNDILLETINKYKENEERLLDGISDLEEALAIKSNESDKHADELALKRKELLENIRVTDLQREREDTRNILKKTTEEICSLKEQLRIEHENGQIKESEIVKLTCIVSDLEMKNTKNSDITGKIEEKLITCLEEEEKQKSEIHKLKNLLSGTNEILEEKEKEVSCLNEIRQRDHLEIKVNKGIYNIS